MKISQNPFSEENEDHRIRHSYFVMAVLCIFFMILLRLWYLQVIRGYEYRKLSESNRTRIQDIVPQRGIILDRHGLPLVQNLPAYNLSVIREDVPKPELLVSRLAFLLNKPFDEVWEKFEALKAKPAFQPALLYTGLDQEEVVALETQRFELPGIVIQVNPRRNYVFDQLASHVIGYLGEVSPAQLKQEKYAEHRMGDLAGQHGLERMWETSLHGKRGNRVVEVDASGRVLKIIKNTPPQPGHNLYLTLDSRLQGICQQALGDQVGAIVVIDPTSGEILALASTPTFSQNAFVQGISVDEWNDLTTNPFHPMENRAIAGQYPPGSTFKIVSLAAALQENVIGVNEKITCRGGFEFGDRVFHCWNRGRTWLGGCHPGDSGILRHLFL